MEFKHKQHDQMMIAKIADSKDGAKALLLPWKTSNFSKGIEKMMQWADHFKNKTHILVDYA